MDSYNIKPESLNLICKCMYEVISLSGQFAFTLEDKEMYDELEILKRQNACCFRALGETINLLEEAKYDRLNPRIFEVTAFLYDMINTCRSKLRKTGIEIEYDGVQPCYVNIDPDRFAVCILNLIVNSLANVDREEGKIKISVKNLFTDVRVQIIDNGYGMSAQKAADSMNVDTHGGLTILKKFCEAFNVSAIFETCENGGFSISLKIPSAPTPIDVHSSRASLGDGIFSASNILLAKLDFLEIDALY